MVIRQALVTLYLSLRKGMLFFFSFGECVDERILHPSPILDVCVTHFLLVIKFDSKDFIKIFMVVRYGGTCL